MTLTKRLAIGALLVMLLLCGSAFKTHAGRAPRVIKITASRFHFTPDNITLKRGEPVTFEITSADATHGFMIRAFNIDTDLKPGKVVLMNVTPAAAGTFKAICDHYCGLGHGMMKLTVVVQ